MFSPFYLAVVFIIIVLVVVLVLRSEFLKRARISRSLNLRLLAVRFAKEPAENVSIEQLRQKIALMEQFYTHLSSIHDSWWRELWYGKPAFSLELTIPSVGEELSFFIAVPRRFVSSVEKVIQGIFPDAFLEVSRDYNIFNPEGAAVGAQVRMTKNQFYPVRTYQKLEGDPMGALTNVFTKLAREGEGAALQIVARPADLKWRGILREHAKKLLRGEEPQQGGGLLEAVRILSEIAEPPKSPEEQAREKERRLETKATPVQEDVARGLEAKASKALFEANVRLVASAATRERADAIMGDLKIALSQFTDQNTNGFSVSAVERQRLEKLLRDFSFRSFNERGYAVLSTEELTSLFHFQNVPLEAPVVKTQKSREAPPPADMPREGLLLGYNQFRGEKRDIYLQDDDRRRHLYIIGQTGTGKTAFLENMIVQDIEDGKGIAFIDPHGDTIEKILGAIPRHRAQDVVYFNPGDIERPMGLNMLEYDPAFPEQKTLIVDELIGIFNKLFNMSIAGGPMFEQYFRNAALLVMDDPASGNTIVDIVRVLSDKAFRDYKLSLSRNIVVKNFWTQIAEKAGGESSLKDIVPYITSKVDNFIANEILRPIIMQEKSAFRFRDVMDGGKILLVNLSKGRLGELNSSFIGLILVGKLLMAALSRASVSEEKRKDFYLYIDEFQNVTTDSIATILSEARKYRLNLTITHQFIGQLPEEIKKAVFGNVGSMASFRIGSDDAEFIAKQFAPVFTDYDLLNVDNWNCFVKLLINGQTSRPFSMKTNPPVHGDPALAETIKEISRTKYGRPREEVEREIIEKHSV